MSSADFLGALVPENSAVPLLVWFSLVTHVALLAARTAGETFADLTAVLLSSLELEVTVA